jgi:hypothetical protein
MRLENVKPGVSMLRYIIRSSATCASMMIIALLAPAAWADLAIHPSLQILRPTEADVGPDPGQEWPIEFGTAVVIRNQEAFVGMPGENLVGVFAAGSTSLSRIGTLTASDAGAFDSFGRTLAYRDGILVVGSQNAAYIFQRSNGVWTQRQKLSAPASDDVGTFADSLRYQDGTLAVGANADRTRTAGVPGAVYIYERNSTGRFIPRGKLVSTDSSPNDDFGRDVSMTNSVIVVGAPGTGTAYVFRRNTSGSWRHHQTLIASELDRPSAFGTAVAIDQAMIIVGAPFAPAEDTAASDGYGAAYGFLPRNGVYVESFKLKPSADDNIRYNLFGRQVAMFDQRIVVGAQRSVTSEAALNGVAAFTYTRSGSSVTPRGVALSNYASTSLSLANQRLLVGVPCDSEPTGYCMGYAELYNLNVFE